jgi:hypothetical protein
MRGRRLAAPPDQRLPAHRQKLEHFLMVRRSRRETAGRLGGRPCRARVCRQPPGGPCPIRPARLVGPTRW